MKQPVSMMENRELYVTYTNSAKSEKYDALTEMAKRIKFKMITPDVVPVFKKYKLNGAGCQRW